MTKEIHDINARALDFVVELIEYIFEYPDDDYMTMECLCRKLHKYGLVDKKDGFYLVAGDALRKTENSSEKPNNCEPFDKDINVRSKDEPQTEELPPYLIRDWEGYLDDFEVEDEPQTERSSE